MFPLIIGLVILLACVLVIVCLIRTVGLSKSVLPSIALLALLVCTPVLIIASIHRKVENKPDFEHTSYETSLSCRKCHADNYKSWHASYHRTMTQTPTPESVVGDFDDVSVTFKGLDCRLYIEDDSFYMNLPSPVWEAQVISNGESPGDVQSPPRKTYKVDLLIGSHNMQVYLNRFPNGEYKVLPLTWHISENRWISRGGSFLHPDSPGLYDKSFVWNNNCLYCHNTRPNPGLVASPGYPEEPARAWNTQVHELGIACEACHGPAGEHVAQNHNPVRRYYLAETETGDSSIIEPSRLSQDDSMNICGRCHGRWSARDEHTYKQQTRGEFLVPGGPPPAEHYSIPLPSPGEEYSAEKYIGMFWPDWTHKSTGLEYQGTLLSPCYKGGTMTCLSCHSMHQSDPNDQLRFPEDPGSKQFESNQSCIQCHQTYSDPETLSEHSHHSSDSQASLCYNCHMPYQSYGLLKAVRTHKISSPNATVTRDIRIPNACNQCHVDQTLEWTATYLNSWYNQPVPVFARDDQTVSVTVIDLLKGDPLQRSLAAARLGSHDHRDSVGLWRSAFLAYGLEDPYPAVRFMAQKSLHAIPGFEQMEFDYLGSESERTLQLRAIRERYRQLLKGSPPTPGSAIPLTASGEPDPSVIQRLISERDTSDIYIEE